ncbi:MAG: DUF4124 domain-containing protein [Gammaproteobacteria bacterium]|nr:DUF4124 domain-containing protein [Gammaproteobacteria bacterium]
MKTPIATLLCLLILSLPALAEDLYKWIDENGIVHYGDAIPAEASRSERHVLNKHGVTVKVLDRQKTIDELNAMAAAAAELEQVQNRKKLQAERDRVLLDTYLAANEIEMLRDRRILAIEARIGVTRHYLENLREQWAELEASALKYNFPYDPDSDLEPLPEKLAEHIVFTENAMAEHMKSLSDLRGQQASLRTQFDSDLERFKLLKERAGLASTSP